MGRGPRDAGSGTWAIFAGGGTAGHLLPGIAVAGALAPRGYPADRILFVGAERGPEATLVPQAGYRVVLLPGRGIQRRLAVANIGAVVGLLRALGRAMGLVRRERPAVVVALGGYASAACVVAAIVWRVPLVVMEQNARAGLANRLAGRFARAAAVPFAETDLPRAHVTGNPVRPEILAVDVAGQRHAARQALGLPQDRTVLGVFSGSLGSARINTAVRGALEVWAARTDLAVRHVVGSRDWDAGEPPEPRHGGGLHYDPVRYEERMDLLLAAADLVVCRAGGSTVAELAVVGVPSVLVPLPIATRDHQTANARALVEAGAAVLVPDGELTTERLVAEVDALMATPDGLHTMAVAARALGRPDAADAVAALLCTEARS